MKNYQKYACKYRLENYLERLKNGQDYQELEAIVRNRVRETLLDSKKLIGHILASIVKVLRNDPNRYLLIDRMQLTPFTTTTIINYNSFLASRRLLLSHFSTIIIRLDSVKIMWISIISKLGF
jgi:hypothetical protein